MIALLQRVSSAAVTSAGETIAAIGPGLLVFVGVQRDDADDDALQLLHRLLKYRVFSDKDGKMNLNLQQIAGDLLLVPQFTLAADTRRGLRPGFSSAASPALGGRLYARLIQAAQEQHPRAVSGRFGAAMQVSLVNDGPVTFWLET